MPIFHIAEADAWRDAQAVGRYDRSTLGADLARVGFIHCSFRDQVARVGGLIYAPAGAGDLVVLELDHALLSASGADLRHEDGGDGELFPHLYGPIDPAWVVAVHPADASGGTFRWG